MYAWPQIFTQICTFTKPYHLSELRHYTCDIDSWVPKEAGIFYKSSPVSAKMFSVTSIPTEKLRTQANNKKQLFYFN